MLDCLLPDVIVLNGASSSGKTSIAKGIQEALPTVFLNFSIDSILYALPPADLARMMAGEPITRDGYDYGKLVEGHHAAAAGLLAKGHRLILDNALTEPAWKADLKAHLAGYRAFWVGVSCKDSVLAKRERARGDRATGTALREACSVHLGLHYDLELDTTRCRPDEAVAAIMAALADQRRH